MKNFDPAGLDLNAWPQDSNKGQTALLTAPQLDTAATRVVTFAFPSIRLSATLDQDINLAIPVSHWKRAEVRLWVCTAAGAANGNVKWRLRAYPMTENTDASVVAFAPPVDRTFVLAQPTMNILKTVDLGVVNLNNLTALTITRMGADAADTATTAQDVIAVLFRDADGIQRD